MILMKPFNVESQNHLSLFLFYFMVFSSTIYIDVNGNVAFQIKQWQPKIDLWGAPAITLVQKFKRTICITSLVSVT